MRLQRGKFAFFLQGVLLFLLINSYPLSVWLGRPIPSPALPLLGLLFLVLNLQLPPKGSLSTRLAVLESGGRLLRLFLLTVVLGGALWIIWVIACPAVSAVWAVVQLLLLIFLEGILFWNGMIRVYLTSVQLGIRWRVLGALCGWIPLVNLWALSRILRITKREVVLECQRLELERVRAASAVCATRYPLLLVHGVFFRDSNLINYWGRIPAALKRCGAQVYYGGQQSAASVANSGEEIARRIREIVEQTGCEKVNLIAHSKGGLDCRYAISRAGASEMVASLTTVCTPHRGCRFAQRLLEQIPRPVQWFIARRYNSTAKLIGDQNPDFLAAVRDLTASGCAAFNEKTPNAPGVYYQSVGAVMKRAGNGRFPLNLTYPLVKHYDGENDGLVAVDSMPWGARFVLVQTKGRGVSHGDMVDLNRENIPGFDVREFYQQIVRDLKERGF